jgi:hypothetical protein
MILPVEREGVIVEPNLWSLPPVQAHPYITTPNGGLANVLLDLIVAVATVVSWAAFRVARLGGENVPHMSKDLRTCASSATLQRRGRWIE